MAQVVTNENMQEFLQNRQVPEFKAPDVKAEAAKPSEPAAADSAKPAPQQVDAEEQPRGEDGKFVPKDETKEAAQAAGDDEEEEDADLPERVRRQIGKKHRAMKEAEEFGREEYRARKAAEDRAAALEQQLDALKSKSGPKPEKGADAPKPEDFKTVAEYADALTDYLLEKKLAAREQKSTQDRQAQVIQSAQQAFGERVAAVAKDIPDYYEVVGAADVDVPPHVVGFIVNRGDMGVRLGYHLAKHPAELDRIKKLDPFSAVAELRDLERTLDKKPEPAQPGASAKPSVSKAPTPITPLDGKSTPVEQDESKMSFSQLRDKRNAERAAGKYKR